MAPRLVFTLRAVAAVVLCVAVIGCDRGPSAGAAVDCDAIRADLEPLLSARLGDVSRTTGPGQSLRALHRWTERHLVAHDNWTALGWCAYSAGEFDQAHEAFSEARQRVRLSGDATVGLAFVAAIVVLAIIFMFV